MNFEANLKTLVEKESVAQKKKAPRGDVRIKQRVAARSIAPHSSNCERDERLDVRQAYIPRPGNPLRLSVNCVEREKSDGDRRGFAVHILRVCGLLTVLELR